MICVSTVRRTSLPPPSTWSASSPRHPVWFCVWASLLVHQLMSEIRYYQTNEDDIVMEVEVFI